MKMIKNSKEALNLLHDDIRMVIGKPRQWRSSLGWSMWDWTSRNGSSRTR